MEPLAAPPAEPLAEPSEEPLAAQWQQLGFRREGEGWKIAMGLLSFERGVSTLGQQMAFRNELDEIIAAAKANGAARNPLVRQRIAKAEIGFSEVAVNEDVAKVSVIGVGMRSQR